jgi:hypothetical protein
VASANNFTHNNFTDRNQSVMKMTLQDCHSKHKSLHSLKMQMACNELTKPALTSVNTSSSCSNSINLVTLFPAILFAEFNNSLVSSLVLILKKQNVKTHAFTERIYRPPIG